MARYSTSAQNVSAEYEAAESEFDLGGITVCLFLYLAMPSMNCPEMAETLLQV